MNRRSFLSSLARLGAAVAASPLLSLVPAPLADRYFALLRKRREDHMAALAKAMEEIEAEFWKPTGRPMPTHTVYSIAYQMNPDPKAHTISWKYDRSNS